jgi:hypothetical protein
METTILTTGLACIIASVIGGGLKAFNIEIPKIATRPRQIALFALGIVLCLIAFALRPEQPEGLGYPNNTSATQPPHPSIDTSASPPTPEPPSPVAVATPLPAPTPRDPPCPSVVPYPQPNHFFIVSWNKVEKASSYNIEVDCFGCNGQQWFSLAGTPWHLKQGVGLRSTIYSSMIHEQMRDERGKAIRWRVQAVDENGQLGDKSSWCQISFVGG